MKTLIQTCTAITFATMVPLNAQTSETTTKSEVTQNVDGSVTRTDSATTVTFTPEARTKVVKYFDTYKADPMGLPPGWVSRVKVQEIPATWRTSRIAPGAVIQESERSYLVDAPPELVSVLPAPRAEVRYYVAGSNVVAVDKGYRIVDSIQIPSIRFTATDVPAGHVEREVHVEKHVTRERDDDDDDDDDDD
jgi:hypothetical protein